MMPENTNRQPYRPSNIYWQQRPDQFARQPQPAPEAEKASTAVGLLTPPARTQPADQFAPQTGQTQQPGISWQPPQIVGPPPQRPRRDRARGAAIFALTCLLAIVFGVGLFSGWTFAHTYGSPGGALPAATTTTGTLPRSSDLTMLEAAQEQAIAKTLPAVVEIRGALPQGVSIGSGVIIDRQGDIVTNNHVIDGASALTVTFSNGKSQTAQVIGTAPSHDLAVVRIQPFSGMAVATLGDSAQLMVGQEVLAIGSPLGYSSSVTSGVISALNRTGAEGHGVKLNGLIQTSAAINPGNSGGALINLQGQVIGIPTLSAVNSETNTPANGIGFAIPSNTVQDVVGQILGTK